MRREGAWIAAGWVLIILALSLVLHEEWSRIGFEDDQIWYVPVIDAGTRGKDLLDAAGFLADPRHKEYAMFTLNVHTAAILRICGPRPEVFLLVSLGLHAVLSGLVFLLARSLLLPRTWAHATAMLFFAAFLHADSWRWTMAAQHQHVVLAGLAVLLGAIMSERRRAAGRPDAGWRALALLAAALGSFCRIANLVIPGALLALVIAGETDRERSARLRRWLPALAWWFGYPLVEIAVSRPYAIGFALSALPTDLGAPGHYLVLATGSIAALAILDRVLARRAASVGGGADAMGEGSRGRVGRALSWHRLVPVAAVAVFVAIGGLGMLRIAGAMAVSLVAPGGFAQGALNRFHWHYLPVSGPGDLVYVLAGLGLLAAWWRLVREEGTWAALGGWFLVAGYFLTHSGSVPGGSNPTAVPSRYFLYLTPVVLPVLAQTVRAAWLGVAQSLPVTLLVPARLVRAGILVSLAVANVDAFGHQAFRSRMVNAYPSYEGLRAAMLAGSAPWSWPRPVRAVRLDGACQAPHRDRFQSFLAHSWDDRFVPRAALWRAFGYEEGFTATFDGESRVDPGPTIRIAGLSVADEAGREADPFVVAVARAEGLLAAGDSESARGVLWTAYATRPFLLRFLLGDRPLEDLTLVTGGGPLAPWLRGLKHSHLGLTPWDRRPDPALDRTAALVENELRAYVGVIDRLVACEEASQGDGNLLRAARELIAGGEF